MGFEPPWTNAQILLAWELCWIRIDNGYTGVFFRPFPLRFLLAIYSYVISFPRTFHGHGFFIFR